MSIFLFKDSCFFSLLFVITSNVSFLLFNGFTQVHVLESILGECIVIRFFFFRLKRGKKSTNKKNPMMVDKKTLEFSWTHSIANATIANNALFSYRTTQ